jgi:hypothetical protein
MPYLWVLVLAVLLALGLRLRIFEDYRLIPHRADPLLDGIRTVLKASFWIQFGLFWWVALRRLPFLPLRQPLRQHSLRLAALLATGLSLVNLFSESLAIYRLMLASYDLLLESLLLYGAITLNFLFWYWMIDHPPRHPGSLWEISRPAAGSAVSMP